MSLLLSLLKKFLVFIIKKIKGVNIMSNQNYLTSSLLQSADILFLFDDKKYYAHSLVLKMQSEVFSDLIDSVSDNNFSSKNPLIINQETCFNFNEEDVSLFLSQIYNFSHLPIENADDVYKLFKIADMFDSSNIMKRCIQYIQSHKTFLNENNVYDWLQVSEKCNIDFLKKDCIKWMTDNIGLNSIEKMTHLSTSQLREIYSNLNLETILKPHTGEDGVLKILLLAEKFNIQQIIDKSILFIAIHYNLLKNDKRFLDISINSYHKITLKIQDLFNLQKNKNIYSTLQENERNNPQTHNKHYNLDYSCGINNCKGHSFYFWYYHPKNIDEFNTIIRNNYTLFNKNKDCYGNIIRI